MSRKLYSHWDQLQRSTELHCNCSATLRICSQLWFRAVCNWYFIIKQSLLRLLRCTFKFLQLQNSKSFSPTIHPFVSVKRMGIIYCILNHAALIRVLLLILSSARKAVLPCFVLRTLPFYHGFLLKDGAHSLQALHTTISKIQYHSWKMQFSKQH